MNLQARALGMSLAAHAGVFLLVAAAGLVTPRSKAVVLDFSLGSSPNAGPQQAAPVRRPAAAPPEQKTVTPTVKDEEAAPIAKRPEEDRKPSFEQHQESTPGSGEADPGVPSPGSAEEAGSRYLGAHFIFIRDKIFGNLSYPALARKMGWTGKVTVSFTVGPDGGVEDISIVESSGFAALDRGAVEAVKRSCPLPRPPMRTSLIMPIVYRLE